MRNIEIEELVDAAKREDWDTIDDVIPKVCNTQSYIQWAYETGVEDKDGNVRDLAVSILEKAQIPSAHFRDIGKTLYGLMNSDDNPYVRFRAAFALAAHDMGDHGERVIEVLREAKKNPDVADLAEGYLSKVGKL